MALAPGTRLGPYEIQAPLGAGGMGEVYRAQDTRLDRLVAVKVLHPDIARDVHSRQRFEREARAVSRLNHPHICVLYDIGREQLRPDTDEFDFLVMELVEGESLSHVLARGLLPAVQVVRHGLEIAAALEEAHGHGIVHGDLKPGNILMTKFGMKLLDFGLARQLAVASISDLSCAPTEPVSGTVAGTVPYMAPEVLRGAACDTRGDLWALGIVLHEMATGVRPFTGQTAFDVSAAILNQPPATAPVWVPLGLQVIIRRCLAKDPHDRYQHASEVGVALEAVQSDPSIAPPAAAGAHNLPLQLTRFIGREREIAEVTALVATERLVTLTGAGGAGKTRLALQAAEGLVENFQHGVWMIELAPLGDPDLIPHAVASTLGMRQESGRGMTDALLDFLRPRTTLLLLDNCEHLIAACATLVTEILRACRRVHILATSREALGIAGERAWRVPSLALPDIKARAAADVAARSDAVRFFVDRVQTVAPQFALSPGNTSTVVRICHRLDGIPLALELAAARMKVLSLEQISARLDDRFQLLTGGSRTAMPRQQTLRAAIDWSYDLLSEAERQLLRRLSVFAGGCSLQAAEHVCGGNALVDGDTIELLSHLIDKSLVVVDDDPADGRRYRLPETVRQYSRDRLLESGEAAALRDRHFCFFYHLALGAKPELPGPNRETSVRQLNADHDNLRAALEWCLTTAGSTEAPLRIVGALWRFWIQQCHFGEGRQWVERALAAAPDAPLSLRARASAAAADLSYFQGDYAAVEAYANDVLALDELGLDEDAWVAAFALFALGILAMDRGALDEGAAFGERCLQRAEETGAGWFTSLAPVILIYRALQQNDLPRARALAERPVMRCRQQGDEFLLAHALFTLSTVMVFQGEFESALSAAREGLKLSLKQSDVRGMTWCLIPVGSALAALTQVSRAARLWGAAEGLSQSIGAPLPSTILVTRDLHLPSVRQALGEERFAAAWTEGRQLTPDAAVAYALQDDNAQ